MASLLRKSLQLTSKSRISSSLLPKQHLHISSLNQISSNPPPPPLPSFHHRNFSSSSSSSEAKKKNFTAKEKLSRVIDSEIECAQEEKDDADQLTLGLPIRLMDPVSEGGLLPNGFPFEIIDNPGEETIILKREFEGENIEVLVHMSQEEFGQDNEDDEDEDDDNDKKSDQFNLSLIVTVVKGDSAHRLEFACSVSPDDVTIDSMVMKLPDDSSKEIAYEGPEFSDLDVDLQREFHDYLDRRGIKSSMADFLQEYMLKKESKEYLQWLKNMKQFVER